MFPGVDATDAPVVDTCRSRAALHRAVGVRAVRLEGGFWGHVRERNRTLTLPSQYRQLETTGRLDNFRRAAGAMGGSFQGAVYNDSDVYKWLEAAAWTLATDHDASLRTSVETVTGLIAAAQGDDGYLNTYFMADRAAERWTNLRDMHELYCAGHLIQAAVAHHRAVGTEELLRVAVRLADHILAVFGPGRRAGTSGHPEIELALVELTRETGDDRYLKQAELFLEERGRTPPRVGGDVYHQDHLPIREQREVAGHAVRALYLYSGVTDVYLETGNRVWLETVLALWRNFHERRVYVTGGAGARHEGEAFGDDYELPNGRAYAETCAAIAHIMWAWRLLLATGECRYADAMEWTLYNGMLAGVGLDGVSYFYVNPLADRGEHRRQPWFGTACCPPNLARTLASLPGYIYTTSPDALCVHLYTPNTARIQLDGGGQVTITQRTQYPWDGEIAIEVRLASVATFALCLRIPSWCEEATLSVNGEHVPEEVQTGRYATVRREWRDGDVVRLTLPMPVRLLTSHPHVLENLERAAVTRGPLVYCIEGNDHPGLEVWHVSLPSQARWAVDRDAMLDGAVVLRTTGFIRGPVPPGHALYAPLPSTAPATAPVPVTAVPYYAWANRRPGAMQTWIPVTE